jgi:hypothetical protein
MKTTGLGLLALVIVLAIVGVLMLHSVQGTPRTSATPAAPTSSQLNNAIRAAQGVVQQSQQPAPDTTAP